MRWSTSSSHSEKQRNRSQVTAKCCSLGIGHPVAIRRDNQQRCRSPWATQGRLVSTFARWCLHLTLGCTARFCTLGRPALFYRNDNDRYVRHNGMGRERL